MASTSTTTTAASVTVSSQHNPTATTTATTTTTSSSSSRKTTRPTAVSIDALVVMKIVKHARENPQQWVEGHLLGLLNEHNVFEITNCFPQPKLSEEEAEEDDGGAAAEYASAMLHELRDVNAEYQSMGWYKVADMGTFYDLKMVETQREWQSELEEAIMLIYDPAQISQGALSFKALRLSERAMRLLNEDVASAEAIKRNKVTYHHLFEEVAIGLKTSPLAKALVPELVGQLRHDDIFDRLDLTTQSFMEKNVSLLMECIRSLSDESQKYQNYQRALARYQQVVQQHVQQVKADNAERAAKGLPLLSEDDLPPHIKEPTPPSRLEALLNTAQINAYCQQLCRVGSQSFGKLYLAKAIQRQG